MAESWIDRHSVNCYFCGKLFDEREGLNADEYNGGDGGTICNRCVAERELLGEALEEVEKVALTLGWTVEAVLNELIKEHKNIAHKQE
jgi:hypothetical protein